MSVSAAAALLVLVDTMLLSSLWRGRLGLETASGRLDGALRTLGRRDGLVLDHVGLREFAGQDDLDALGVLGNEIRLDETRNRDVGARDAREIVEGQLRA